MVTGSTGPRKRGHQRTTTGAATWSWDVDAPVGQWLSHHVQLHCLDSDWHWSLRVLGSLSEVQTTTPKEPVMRVTTSS